MSLDEAIQRMTDKIKAACAGAEIKAVKMSDEEAPLLQFTDELGYERLHPRVNPTGGAIALGHPIGASGVIFFGEMAHHLKRTSGKAGVQMLCGGGGVGIATVVEAV